MRKVKVFLMCALLCAAFLVNRAHAADKFGYVDLSRVFSEYSKTKSYDKVLTEKQKSYEEERTKLVNDIKQFQDKMNLLSDREKEAKKPDLESKIKSLQEFDRQKQTDLRKEQDEKMKEILKDIEETVRTFAEKEGYTMIFNERVLVYQSKDMDITSSIIDLINKKK